MKRAYLTILVALSWLILGGFVMGGLLSATVDPKSDRLPTFAVVVIVVYLLTFSVIFLMGTARWAKAKGYPGIVGVILGWIGPLGLIILVFLPDQTKGTSQAV